MYTHVLNRLCFFSNSVCMDGRRIEGDGAAAQYTMDNRCADVRAVCNGMHMVCIINGMHMGVYVCRRCMK